MWTDFFTPFRWLTRGILLLLLAVFGTIPTVASINRFGASIRIGERGLDEVMLNWWTGNVCRLFGVNVIARGTIAPPPTLVVANHVSWLDILVLHHCAAMGFVSKAEIARWPFIGQLARVSGTVFHHRGSHASASNVGDAMVARLNEQRRVAIFPEGGIHSGDHVKKFYARMFKAAIEAEVPVQPVMIRYLSGGQRDADVTFLGNENFIRNMIRMMGRKTCIGDVRFLDPIAAAGRSRNEIADEAFELINAAYNEFPAS